MFNCEKFNNAYTIEESEADKMHPLLSVCVYDVYMCVHVLEYMHKCLVYHM